jgi:hypothetical protein
MNNFFKKYSSLIETVFKITALTYFFVSFYYFFFLSQAGGGDESLFVSDLIFIKANGWIAAIEKSISIPYMILVYPFSLFFKEYVALRIANVFLFLLLLLYFFKTVKIRVSSFYFYLFFFIGTSAYFFKGTNDALFFTGLAVFMIEVFYFIENKKMNNQVLAFSGLIVAFFTREMFLVYLPVIILGFYFLYTEGFVFLSKKMIFPLLLFFFFMGVNIPSIQLNEKLSYDNKKPPSALKVNWAQRQYLAQLLVNKSEIHNFSHPSWEQTQDYLIVNGPESLPDGVVEGLLFDYSLTIKEFFKDFYYSMFFGLRQLGLILLFPFYVIIKNLKKKNVLNAELFIPFSLLIMICVFSLIIISFIEPRWYMSVFMITIVFYNNNQIQKRINPNYILMNYFVLTFFSIYGIYGIFHNLIGII